MNVREVLTQKLAAYIAKGQTFSLFTIENGELKYKTESFEPENDEDVDLCSLAWNDQYQNVIDILQDNEPIGGYTFYVKEKLDEIFEIEEGHFGDEGQAEIKAIFDHTDHEKAVEAANLAFDVNGCETILACVDLELGIVGIRFYI